ncbi:P-loop containing nucleoside triphosphate hydrolase protein [Lactarius pseudohatsudake]|nr:P-loop containing nucleoside triphosphate hydrolase protein [Lactarius pseudohatsudake]
MERQAVQSDSSYVHLPCIGTRNPRVKKVAGRVEVDTIFRQRYLCVAIDEAHAFRDPNKAYTAVRALREKTDMLVAMTWTPLQTRPSDLWHIGKVIGLSGFKDDVHTNEELARMQRELAEARQEDKKIQLDHEAESLGVLHRTSHGEIEGTISVSEKAVEQKFQNVKAQWMKVVHERYHGAVIRRTVNSLDYLGNTISGLEPYEEHVCMLELHEHEYKALGDIASQRLAKTYKSLRRLECEVSEGFALPLFYSFFQQCVLHPVFVHQRLEESQEKEEYEKLGSYEGYRAIPSCKLDSLVEIVNHHLAADDKPGIEPSRQRPLGAFLTPGALAPPTQSPSPPSSPLRQQKKQNKASLAHQTPDKIVVCSYFVRSLDLIQTVLNEHDIQAFKIDGRAEQEETVKILEEFKNSRRDGPRVLLISNASSIGLNIACANILIIVDVLRSVMSDQQLIGRVWCHPQSKRVHIYRLVGERSPDVFLNTLSFTEGYITESFLNSDHRIRGWPDR